MKHSDSTEHKARMVKVFNKFDNNKKGFLDREEIKQALLHIYNGLKFSDADVDRVFTETDKNGDGKIQLEEFLSNKNFHAI